MRRAVCKRCGGDNFREFGEVEIHADVTRKIEEVSLHDDGSVSAKSARRIDDGDLDFLSLDAEEHAVFLGVECVACGLDAKHIDGLAVAEPTTGDKVNLPDGRVAYVTDARVINPGGLSKPYMEVRADDEWWPYRDVDAWQPHPGQLDLPVAA